MLRRRKQKPESERERERRLAVNAVGRMTDGALLEAIHSRSDPKSSLLLLYQYSVSGVEYSAGQDISSLLDRIPSGAYWPAADVTVKYDPQDPSNSIVVCEQWSGLPSDVPRRGTAGAQSRDIHVAWQGAEEKPLVRTDWNGTDHR
jgi:hypothetical protein